MDRQSRSSEDPAQAHPGGEAAGGRFRETIDRFAVPSAQWLRATALVDQGLVSAASLVTVVILQRLAGNQQLGMYSLGLTAVFTAINVHESLITAPYTVFVNLEALGDGELRRYTGTALFQTLLMGVAVAVVMLVCGLVARPIGIPTAGPVAFALAGALPFILLREGGRRICLAHSQMPLLLLVDGLAVVSQLGVLVTLGLRGVLDARAAIVVLGLTSAAAFLLWALIARKTVGWRRPRLFIHIRRSWNLGRWILWSSVATVLTNYSVHWILALGIGTVASGAFEAIRSVANLVNPVIAGLRNYMGPIAARLRKRVGVPAVQKLVGSATWLILGVGAAWIAVIALAGGRMMTTLYGVEYVQHGPVLLTTAAAVAVFGLGIPADQGLWALERPVLTAFAATAGFVTTVTVALLVGPDLFLTAGAFLCGKIVELTLRMAGFHLAARAHRRQL